ncbi:MAG: hypothetical protein LBR70_04995 [Lactobacillaceae bacterium]|jgi:hypothetical protein|nr:hypothetical protein [Lactobacillaceae bacterium]
MTKVYAANAQGTYDLDPPSGYDAWIDYWNSKKGLIAGKCRQCNEQSKDLVGAHVQLVEKRSDGQWYYKNNVLYIVPSCIGCNNHNNKTVFSVEWDDLVPAPKA